MSFLSKLPAADTRLGFTLELPPMGDLADPQIIKTIFPIPSNRTRRNLRTVPVDIERAPPNVPAAEGGSG